MSVVDGREAKEQKERRRGSTTARRVENRLTYNAAGLRETEKVKGANLMELLRGTANEGVHTDYSYTDRYELDLSGKAQLTATWTVGAALADTGRAYDYDAIGNRTGDQAGAYTIQTGYPGAPSPSAAVNEYLHTPYDGGAAATYDLNGNLLTDGIRTCEYDGENRLVRVTQGGYRLDFKYDYLGRRIAKTVYTWSSAIGDWLLTSERRFLYDGWNLIAELDPAGAILRKFVWGLDVSGTFQGVGGVGGLLLIEDGANRYYPIYDASHNVIGLYDQTGATVAAYEYDPFGNLTNAAGAYAADNPFRYSTKYTDTETNLIYYGHRYYDPLLGRFLNRDPIAEEGGLNLYGFCGNDGVNNWDYLGLDGDWEVSKRIGPDSMEDWRRERWEIPFRELDPWRLGGIVRRDFLSADSEDAVETVDGGTFEPFYVTAERDDAPGHFRDVPGQGAFRLLRQSEEGWYAERLGDYFGREYGSKGPGIDPRLHIDLDTVSFKEVAKNFAIGALIGVGMTAYGLVTGGIGPALMLSMALPYLGSTIDNWDRMSNQERWNFGAQIAGGLAGGGAMLRVASPTGASSSGAFVENPGAQLALPAGPKYNPWTGAIRSELTSSGSIMYRVWGDETGQFGGWLTPTRPSSSLSAIRELALPPGNSARMVSEVVVPAGMRIQIGTAARAFGQPGGGTQVFLLNPLPRPNFGPGTLLGPRPGGG